MNQTEMIAAATAHRACCGTEHDPSKGKLHGYCVVCGVPWPCETALQFIAQPQQGEGGNSPAQSSPHNIGYKFVVLFELEVA